MCRRHSGILAKLEEASESVLAVGKFAPAPAVRNEPDIFPQSSPVEILNVVKVRIVENVDLVADSRIDVDVPFGIDAELSGVGGKVSDTSFGRWFVRRHGLAINPGRVCHHAAAFCDSVPGF